MMWLGRKRRPKTPPCRGPLNPDILRVGDVVRYKRYYEDYGWDEFVVYQILYSPDQDVMVRMRKIDSQDQYYPAKGLRRKSW